MRPVFYLTYDVRLVNSFLASVLPCVILALKSLAVA
jgi:hypothetical protein